MTPRGGYHHQRRTGQFRMLPDMLDQRKSVHLGHHVVQQDKGERLAGPLRMLQYGQCLFAAGHHGGFHSPVQQQALQDPSIGGVIVDSQHRQAAQLSGFLGETPLQCAGRQTELGGEVKSTALSGLTLHPDAPVHALHQFRGDSQAQPATAVPAARRGIDLGKRLEQPVELVRRNANTRVIHAEAENNLESDSDSRSTRTTTSPRSVNLMALPTRLTMICRNRPGSPISSSGTSEVDFVGQLQSLGVGPRPECGQSLVQVVAQV